MQIKLNIEDAIMAGANDEIAPILSHPSQDK